MVEHDKESLEEQVSEETVAEETTKESEITPEQAQEQLDTMQQFCTIYLDCSVTDFIAKALYKKQCHKMNELHLNLMQVLSYFNNYHMQAEALMKTPLKLVTEFGSTEEFNEYFKQENELRQKHFHNLMEIKATQAIITERLGFLKFVDESYTGRPVDLPKSGNASVDNN